MFLISGPPRRLQARRRPAALGLAGFTALAQLASPTLCVALGGITASTVRSSPPFPAVAAQSAVLRAADPAGVARALLDALAPGEAEATTRPGSGRSDALEREGLQSEKARRHAGLVLEPAQLGASLSFSAQRWIRSNPAERMERSRVRAS